MSKMDFYQQLTKVEFLSSFKGVGTYCNRRNVINPVSNEEELAIIQKLFECNLATNIDDETGALIIAKRKYFKK